MGKPVMVMKFWAGSFRAGAWPARGAGGALSLLIACGNAVSPADQGSLDDAGAQQAGAGGDAEVGGRSGAGGPSSESGGAGGSGLNGDAGNSNPSTGGAVAAAGAGASTATQGGSSGLGGTLSAGGRAGASAVGGVPSAGGGGEGSVVGGAASAGGGAAVGGSGGEGGEKPLLLPPGCEPRGRSEDSDSCFLGVFCGATPNLTNCTRLASGNWQCSCELAHHDRIYEIEGAPGIQACAVASGLCAEDDLQLGAETCAAPRNTSSVDGCELELSCGKPITVGFAPGVRASLMNYGSGMCRRLGSSELFECSCDHGQVNAEYGLLAESGTLACRPLVDFCMSAAEPAFDEPPTCVDTEANSNGEGCQLLQGCGKPMRLTETVRIEKLEPRYADCSPSEAGGSSCYCSGRDTTFQFQVEAESTAETCASSILNCGEDTTIVAGGEVSCQATSQIAFSDSCQADLDCLQPASVDGRAIIAQGRLGVYCRREAANQPWWCSCGSNQDSKIFEYGAPSSSPWDVCTAAPQRCLEQMPIFIGPYGEYKDPPDPLM